MTLSRESNANIQMELDQGEEREGCSNPSLGTLCAFHRKGRKEQAVCIMELFLWGRDKVMGFACPAQCPSSQLYQPSFVLCEERTCYISPRTV